MSDANQPKVELFVKVSDLIDGEEEKKKKKSDATLVLARQATVRLFENLAGLKCRVCFRLSYLFIGV